VGGYLVVVEAGAAGDAGDDVVGGFDAETPASLVEEQRWGVVGAGPVGAFVEPGGERGAQLGVDGDLSDALAFAVDPHVPFAGGEGDVVDVEGDGLGDAGTGVERDEGEGLVAERWAAGDGAQVTDLGSFAEGAGRGGGDLDAGGAGGAEAAAGVEVIDRREGAVHRGRFALHYALEVVAVVAHGPVPAVGAAERVALDVGDGKPGQVLAGLGGVRAPALVGERGRGEGGDVGVEHLGEGAGQVDGGASMPWRRGGRPVL
jgi:hypothetical protein